MTSSPVTDSTLLGNKGVIPLLRAFREGVTIKRDRPDAATTQKISSETLRRTQELVLAAQAIGVEPSAGLLQKAKRQAALDVLSDHQTAELYGVKTGHQDFSMKIHPILEACALC